MMNAVVLTDDLPLELNVANDEILQRDDLGTRKPTLNNRNTVYVNRKPCPN